MEKLKSIYVASWSAVVTIVTVTVVTLVSELSVPFKTWLASFTGHHWVTKSWLSVIVFVLMFGLLHLVTRNVDVTKTKRVLIALQLTAVLGFLIILGFYTYEFFKH